MALRSTMGSHNIPEGAVRLSKEEALAYQQRFIRDWPRERDVIFLRYSGHMAAAVAFATSIVCWSHFRPQLNLRSKGRLFTFIPASVAPTILTAGLYNKYVTNKILLMKPDCPLCQVIPYALIQTFQGLVYPTITGLLISSFLAETYKTTYVPDLKKYKEFSAFSKSLLKTGAFKFQLIGAVHLITALFLPYMQNTELCDVVTKNDRILEGNFPITQ